MPRYRLRRLSPATQAGMTGGEVEERVIELPAGMAPPPSAEVVDSSVAVSEWTGDTVRRAGTDGRPIMPPRAAVVEASELRVAPEEEGN